MDGVKPKTYCEKWPVGCMFCDLLLCDGRKTIPAVKEYGPECWLKSPVERALREAPLQEDEGDEE